MSSGMAIATPKLGGDFLIFTKTIMGVANRPKNPFQFFILAKNAYGIYSFQIAVGWKPSEGHFFLQTR